MHDDLHLLDLRLQRALRQVIAPAEDRATVPLRLSAWTSADPVPLAEAMQASYSPVAVGDRWGPPWTTTWFRAEGIIPSAWADQPVAAAIDLFQPVTRPGTGAGFQAEALVHGPDGTPLKGLHPRNHEVEVRRRADGNEPVILLIEAASNPIVLDLEFAPTPVGDRTTAGNGPLYPINRADLVVPDDEVRQLRLDAEVLSELLATLDPGQPRYREVALALERMLDVLEPSDVSGTAAAARAELAVALARPAVGSALTMSAVANAHIDSAWLWPLRETVRKCVRTYANVTALAEDHPELVFAASQAQHLAWLAEAAPAVHQRVVTAAKAGAIVPVGGMWVEPDGNLPGSESLARQFVHGQRHFLDTLGVECRVGWMPDSFGYNAALPQVARLAGIRWFLTQKLSWNDTNTFPHHSFRWEGIDGTRIFTHFPPVATYTAELTGAELARAVSAFSEKGRSTRALLPFGFGDGGGGPTAEMLGRARRWRDLEGAPRVEIEPPDRFFAEAEAGYADAPVWWGELYLEVHRATATNQGALKRGNRRCEHLLREAELWSATAAVAADHAYPHDALDRLWKTVLLLQFHDILPGTSIAWVNQEAVATYSDTIAELEDLIAAALAALAGDGYVEWWADAGPALAAAPVDAAPVEDAAPAVTVERVTDGAGADGIVLDNGLVRVTVDGRGLVVSLVDLVADRELVAAGHAAGLLQLHRDEPNRWDAWDLDRSYLRLGTDLDQPVELTVGAAGAESGAVAVERSFGSSTVRQTVSIGRGRREVRFETDVEWAEHERILKLAFPLDLHSHEVAAEIPFGHVRRPTHTNTSWDAARYEHNGHRWLHLDEAGYGVAVLNDTTYGYDVARSAGPGGTVTTVRPSLVRGARNPDPGADAGQHRFVHVVVPGASVAEAVVGAEALNLPLRRFRGGPGPGPGPLVRVEGDGVAVTAVKLADDRSGDVVVRLHEAVGGRAAVRLVPGFALAGAEVVDLLERSDPDHVVDVGLEVEPAGPTVGLRLRPFQIVTVRLHRADPA